MKKELDDTASSLRRGPRDSYHDIVFEAEMRHLAELTYHAYATFVHVVLATTPSRADFMLDL